MKLTLSLLAGTSDFEKYEGKEIELPCVPQIGAVIDFCDVALEVVDVFYTFKPEGLKIYLSMRNWN